MADATPRIRPNPQIAQAYGLDKAIIAALEDDMAAAYDEGIFASKDQLKVALGVLHETMQGGPIMAYLDQVRADAIEAIAKLPDLNPADTVAVGKVQDAIGRYEHLIDWMSRYISASPQPPSSDSDSPEDI